MQIITITIIITVLKLVSLRIVFLYFLTTRLKFRPAKSIMNKSVINCKMNFN